MVSILVIGGKSHSKISDSLYQCFKQKYSTALCADREIQLEDPQPEFCIWETEDLDQRVGDQTILIFRENFSSRDSGKKIQIPGHVTAAIASSQDKDALSLLMGSQVPVITCGLSSRDTITFTSNTDDGVVIALQRTLPDMDGNQVEPVEIPVSLSQEKDGCPESVSRYSLLAAAAALCVTGNMDLIHFLSS